MRIAIIVSVKDPAGLNIKRALIEKHGFLKLNESFGSDHIYSKDLEMTELRLFTAPVESINNENIDEKIADGGFLPELILFATKHESKSGINSLSCHSPGNWGKAEYGGQERKLCKAPANMLKKTFVLLNEMGKEFAEREKFDIVMECTHHGPYVETPIMFIEIGSCEAAWKNEEAGNLIANVIIKLISNINTLSTAKPTCIGLGGLHTCSSFNKVQLGNEYALGHVCPKYALENIDAEMITQALDKTIPAAETIILDWKGLGQHKEKVMAAIEEVKKERETTGRKIDVVKTHSM